MEDDGSCGTALLGTSVAREVIGSVSGVAICNESGLGVFTCNISFLDFSHVFLTAEHEYGGSH